MSIQYCHNCNTNVDTDLEAEHFDIGVECEVCREPIAVCKQSDNENRCQDCYDEWADSWPDQL